MLPFSYTSSFNRDLKRITKQGVNMALLKKTITSLVEQIPLDERYKDHPLKGNWAYHRECHIAPDWLLIYRYEADGIVFVRTGSHSELLDR